MATSVVAKRFNARLVYEQAEFHFIATLDRSHGHCREVLAERHLTTLGTVHGERLFRQVIVHLHLLAFRVKELESYHIRILVLDGHFDFIRSGIVIQQFVQIIRAVYLESTLLAAFIPQFQQFGRRGYLYIVSPSEV